jgi:hypothetical protein
MEMFSNLKYVLFSTLLVSSLNVNAEDTSEQKGGILGDFTYTVSRTSGYNHSQFMLTMESNKYDCFSIIQEKILGSSPAEYCNVGYPFIENLNINNTKPGIYKFEVRAFNEYGGDTLKSYSFNIEILPIADDVRSDSDLSFGYYKKIINQGEVFSVNINSSQFECFKINALTNNYGTVESVCPINGYPYSTTIDLSNISNDFSGNFELEVVGYDIGKESKIKSYPFDMIIEKSNFTPVLIKF